MVEHLLESDFEVVAKVRNGQALFETAMLLQPDIIVSDISMPMLNGMDAADRLRQSGCKSKIIFLSVHVDSEFVDECLLMGASGYVVKSRLASELIPAIQEALAGHIFISPNMSH
jgi:DNA-binding NarL/FixJ family response regulator